MNNDLFTSLQDAQPQVCSYEQVAAARRNYRDLAIRAPFGPEDIGNGMMLGFIYRIVVTAHNDPATLLTDEEVVRYGPVLREIVDKVQTRANKLRESHWYDRLRDAT